MPEPGGSADADLDTLATATALFVKSDDLLKGSPPLAIRTV